MKKRNTYGGFTLIELLVVIAIIALMSSVVFATVTSARKKGQVAYIQSQMKQYVNALEAYELEHNAYPNTNETVCLGHGPCGGNTPEDPSLISALDPYIKGTPVINTGIIDGAQSATYSCVNNSGPCLRESVGRIIWAIPSSNNSACIPGSNYVGVSLPSGNVLCLLTL